MLGKKVVKSKYRLLLALSLLLAIAIMAGAAQAQEDALDVTIEWPNEGETLYAGPESLLFKVPIKGWVTSRDFAANEIELRLDIYKNDAKIGSLTTTPRADGSYQFFVTVNPDASVEEFTVAFQDCDKLCHSPGNMDLQRGELLLRVTAVDANGRGAIAERTLNVDLSHYATVPVNIVRADDPQREVEHVNITASTWVYMWRARFGKGRTEEDGHASVKVEALSQATTHYVFRVDPTVVDGVLYQGVNTAEVTLPPGATTAGPITLAVSAHMG